MNFLKTYSHDSNNSPDEKKGGSDKKCDNIDDTKSWSEKDHDHWSSDIEEVLDNMRQNCIVLSELHKRRYFALQGWLKYFRLPCILLSSVNAVASVGLAAYLQQKHVSLINCGISLITTIITSIEMYLQIEKQMGVENDVSKEYYLLSVDISKILSLKRFNRNIDAYSFLDNAMSKYKNMYENSAVLQKRIVDKLILIDCNALMVKDEEHGNVDDDDNDLVDVYVNSSFLDFKMSKNEIKY